MGESNRLSLTHLPHDDVKVPLSFRGALLAATKASSRSRIEHSACEQGGRLAAGEVEVAGAQAAHALWPRARRSVGGLQLAGAAPLKPAGASSATRARSWFPRSDVLDPAG